jgi:nucleoside 2-deoxyribosyltransferase
MDVFDEVRKERRRQDAKWGEQNHDVWKWLAILGEEKGEADKAALENCFGTGSLRDCRKELIHTAAVAVAAVECMDRVRPAVYLAGPILDCTEREALGWRDEAADWLDFETVDPARARDFREKPAEDPERQIVQPDKEDIAKCGILLANCWKPSWGTAMEILYAWERGKVVVAVVPPGMLRSAWIVTHVHEVFDTVANACLFLNEWVPHRRCRVCGCTDDRACMTEAGPCSWVQADLCSACAE